LGWRIEVDALTLDKRCDGREFAHDFGTGDGFDLGGICGVCVALAVLTDVLLVVVLVAVVVDAAGQVGLEEGEDAEEHFRSHLLIYLDVLFVINPLFVPKHVLDQKRYFFLCLDAVEEDHLAATVSKGLTFLRLGRRSCPLWRWSLQLC
jgi:hypothetical protein